MMHVLSPDLKQKNRERAEKGTALKNAKGRKLPAVYTATEELRSSAGRTEIDKCRR